MRRDEDLFRLPINQVVKLEGGNGLASPAFHAPLTFLGAFGWQHVEEGVEALVCDGEVVPRTHFTTDWLRTLGRRKFLRRVQLQPAPLTDVRATALTSDQIELTLTVSVKYEVVDPGYVASLQDPIGELTNLVIGCAAEFIRSKSFESTVGDEGRLRPLLKQVLEREPSIRGRYSIVQILKALPSGDDRLIEIVRQRRIAAAEHGLTEERGKNRLIEAQYDQQIAARKADLQEMMADRQHGRQMEELHAKLAAETQQSFLQAFADIAAAGMDPSKLAPLLTSDRSSVKTQGRGLLEDRSQPIPESNRGGDQDSPVERERAALASVQAAGHIDSFELLLAGGELVGAIATAPSYEVVLRCGETYPADAPEVTVRFKDGSSFSPSLHWISGVNNMLAQALVAVLPQANQRAPEGNDQGVFRFNFDDSTGEEK